MDWKITEKRTKQINGLDDEHDIDAIAVIYIHSTFNTALACGICFIYSLILNG